MADEHDRLMDLALGEAARASAGGNMAVGSLIVRDGVVVGVGRNRVNSNNDPTAHAEVDAIRDACAKLQTTDLAGATCYTTMEPCPMCCWALQAANIAELVLGARHAAMQRTDYGGYSVEALLAMTGRQMTIVTGIRIAQCEAIRRGP